MFIFSQERRCRWGKRAASRVPGTPCSCSRHAQLGSGHAEGARLPAAELSYGMIYYKFMIVHYVESRIAFYKY